MQLGRSVFISATSKGLGPWRERIADILKPHDIDVKEQTWFTPEKDVLSHEINNLISRVTGVICLIGPYYGYPSSERFQDGRPISCSQCEWLLARKRGKPTLVYVIEDSFFGEDKIESEVDPRLRDSPKFRKWQAEFRDEVKAQSDRHNYRSVKSPEELLLSFAKIDWRAWPPYV